MFLIASRLALSTWRRWFTRHSATRQAYNVLSVTAALFITAVIFIASDTGPASAASPLHSVNVDAPASEV